MILTKVENKYGESEWILLPHKLENGTTIEWKTDESEIDSAMKWTVKFTEA